MRLIGRSNEQQQEQPALVGAGQVDRRDERRDVEREKERPELEPRRALVEKQMEDGPGCEAVAEDDNAEEKRVCVGLGTDDGLTEEDQGRHDDEPGQPSAWGFQPV